MSQYTPKLSHCDTCCDTWFSLSKITGLPYRQWMT
nr:MAG TPA_asm: hypothetical protein [Caudoviricetes sp.]